MPNFCYLGESHRDQVVFSPLSRSVESGRLVMKGNRVLIINFVKNLDVILIHIVENLEDRANLMFDSDATIGIKLVVSFMMNVSLSILYHV